MAGGSVGVIVVLVVCRLVLSRRALRKYIKGRYDFLLRIVKYSIVATYDQICSY